jgi:phytoene synthase
MRSADDARLAADLQHCRAVLRRGSKSFSAAGRLLPPGMRDAFAALYAFCRSADDAVDTGHADAGTLRVLALRLDRVYGDADGPMLAGDYALRWAVHAYGLPRAFLDALLEGFAWELAGRRYETESDLFAYAARVASCVGAAATVFMGRRDAETLARACDLGVAMQLTNIARDVGEDARMGRLYLPRAWMREEGIDPDAFLARPVFTPALGRVVRRLLATADILYRRADHGIGRLPVRCQPAIRAARLLYADIGRVVAANGYDSVSRRACTSTARKAWLLARALAAPGPAQVPARPPLPETRFLVEAAAHSRLAPPPLVLAAAGRP